IRQRYSEVLRVVRARLEKVVAEPEPAPMVLGQASPEDQLGAVAAFRDRQAFLIQVDGILDERGDPRDLSRRLTSLAEEVIVRATDIIRIELGARSGSPDVPFGLFALGKFGAAALGYASDLELLLVHAGQDPSPFFAELLERLQGFFRGKQEGLFEVDLRLRPWGKNAALECSLETFSSYYGPRGPAHSLERIALTRLRPIAGDPDFRRRVAELRDRLVYEEPWLDLDELAETRSRQFRQRQAGFRNAKYSPGGLVDLEYGVQVLQVRHGRELRSLRTPDLEAAIHELGRHDVIAPAEADRLAQVYVFFRQLINALRMLRGVAEDLELPPNDGPEARHLARRMGFHEPGWKAASEALEAEFSTHTALVRDFVRASVGAEMLPR
ncbi:MAG TPA: glutamate-ammonia-ligase adenylyltransferase, partial [Chloroflexota bacterium]